MSLSIRSKNAAVIRMVSSHVTDLYGIKPGLGAIRETRFSKGNIYAVVIEEKVSSFIKDISEDEHDIPGIEVNFGLVFGDVEKQFDLFKAADESLKTNKQK